MPFTLAHAAAVLPVRRAGFVISAFVVGTFGPDFEYFLMLAPRSRYGHEWPGVLVFTLPTCLLALWLFHAFIKRPAAALLPCAIERRVAPLLGEFRFGGPRRFTRIVLSISAGIATHVLWDSFTHQSSWATRRWPALLQMIPVPGLGDWPCYRVLQHASTIVGLAALAVWFVGWLRVTSPVSQTKTAGLTASRKLAVLSGMTVVAAAGAAIRATAAIQARVDDRSVTPSVVVFGVTAASFFSVEMLAYGAWWNRQRPDASSPKVCSDSASVRRTG